MKDFEARNYLLFWRMHSDVVCGTNIGTASAANKGISVIGCDDYVCKNDKIDRMGKSRKHSCLFIKTGT